MKKLLLTLIIVVIYTPVLFAGYTYTIDSYGGLPDLDGTETMLVTGEGGGVLYLKDFSVMTVEGTSALEQWVGGIWTIAPVNYSHLDVLGGEIHEISMNNNATATLSGGLIESIYSYQSVLQWEGDPLELVPNPHIEMIVNEYSWESYDIDTDLLTGLWADDTAFSIYLENQSGYADVIDNIAFTIVPEPATLSMMCLGILLLKKRRAS